MIVGTLIELQRDCVDFWATDGNNETYVQDHIGLLHEGDVIVFLGVAPMDPELEGQKEVCDLLHVISRFGIGFINSSEVPEYSPGGKIGS
jgi:hypothetical protein